MAVKIFNYSEGFQYILLVSTYVSIGILSHYNLKLLRGWSKIKEIGSVQLRAFQGSLCTRPANGKSMEYKNLNNSESFQAILMVIHM